MSRFKRLKQSLLRKWVPSLANEEYVELVLGLMIETRDIGDKSFDLKQYKTDLNIENRWPKNVSIRKN